MFEDLAGLQVQKKAKVPCTAQLLQVLLLDPPGPARLAGSAETSWDLALHCLRPTHPGASVSPWDRSPHDPDRAPNATASLASCNGFAGSFPERSLPCIAGCPLVLRHPPGCDL